MSASPTLVRAESAGAVTTVTLNRPDKRNALNVALLDQLVTALTAAAARPATRIVILHGDGPVFCAGLDLTEAAAAKDPHRSAHLIAEVLQALSSGRIITIAAVHGAAIAGGAGIMAACDFVVAAEGTRIGFPEVRRGLVAALVTTFLRRQLRERDARELLLGGELVDVARARDLGLVNQVCSERDLLAQARRFADQVLQGGPQAVADTKQLLAKLWPRPVREDLDLALAFHLQARNSPEAQEGLAAFQEKRPPGWTRPPQPP